MLNIFNFFKTKNVKIHPTNYYNRKRCETINSSDEFLLQNAKHFNESNYKDLLQNEFNQKIINKTNKNFALRIRGSSF